MHRIQLARRVASISVGTALSVAAIGGSAWAAPSDNGSASPAHQIYTSPQPASTADFSGNGANVHGPYDSTRDGSASMNGNGDITTTGKPCAGCVGKADNKNPKGQLPGGSDNNAGYECDRNNGIGQGNPAHTTCTTTSTPTVTPTTTPTVTTTPVVADVVSTPATVVAPAVSGASTAPAVTPAVAAAKLAPAQVEAVKVVASHATPALGGAASGAKAAPAAHVLGESVTRASSVAPAVAAASLPFTGAPVGGLLLVALVALSVGVALTFGFRRA